MTPRARITPGQEIVVYRRETQDGREVRVALVSALRGDGFSVLLSRSSSDPEAGRPLDVYLSRADAEGVALALREGNELCGMTPHRRSER